MHCCNLQLKKKKKVGNYQLKEREILKNERMKKIFHENTNQNKVYVVILMLDKVDCEAKELVETKGDIS